MKQLLKSLSLLMESGDVVVGSVETDGVFTNRPNTLFHIDPLGPLSVFCMTGSLFCTWLHFSDPDSVSVKPSGSGSDLILPLRRRRVSR